MRKTFSLILSVIMVLSLFTVGAFAAEGTAINSADDFKNMTADGTYYLAADITVSETYAGEFTGTFDGNGKTVTVSAPMFDKMNGTVKNLTTAGKIEYAAAAADEKVHIGAVAKNSVGGKFEKVTNKAAITVTVATKECRVGGICGSVGTAAATFVNCRNEAAISGTEATGGICGEAQKLDTTFEDCYNKGAISSSGTKSGVAAGGIIGYSGTDIITLKNCTNDGNITSGFRAGGIQGDARKSANVTYCINNGTVKGDNISGGIVGYTGDSGINFGTTVKNCINNGEVTGTGGTTGGAAGILGYAWADNASNVKATTMENCINNGNINLVNKGFASEFVAYTNSQYTVIKNCIGVGKINATGNESDLFLCIVGMSNSDITKYTIENLFIADGGATKLLSWATDEAHARNRVEFSAVDGKNLEGSETVKAITRGELNADFIAKANTAIGSEFFALKDGKVVFASSAPAPTPTGDTAAYVAVAAVAAVAILGTALVSKKRTIAE